MIYVMLALLSGLFGRMGGAKGYHTLWRDIGCSAIWVLVCTMLFGWHPWQYALMFGLTWAAFSTYWDSVFGYDNFWFSGAMVGLASFPLIFIDKSLWLFVLCRIIILSVAWGCLNRYLPPKILWWKRDVVEEYLRYTVSL